MTWLWKLDNWVEILFKSKSHFNRKLIPPTFFQIRFAVICHNFSSFQASFVMNLGRWTPTSWRPDHAHLGAGKSRKDRGHQQLFIWCESSHGQTPGIGTIWPRKTSRTERKSWKGDFVQTITINEERDCPCFSSELRSDGRDVYACVLQKGKPLFTKTIALTKGVVW